MRRQRTGIISKNNETYGPKNETFYSFINQKLENVYQKNKIDYYDQCLSFIEQLFPRYHFKMFLLYRGKTPNVVLILFYGSTNRRRSKKRRSRTTK